ncbi:hypothetical protein LCGC14_3027720 [marine sediment metagenome]|uniref:Uncharacterized protein n=1 Tax=marine sediment metagenome TaxID=412755 RepID=A0A0F8WTQ5_9ZZZZ
MKKIKFIKLNGLFNWNVGQELSTEEFQDGTVTLSYKGGEDKEQFVVLSPWYLVKNGYAEWVEETSLVEEKTKVDERETLELLARLNSKLDRLLDDK